MLAITTGPTSIPRTQPICSSTATRKRKEDEDEDEPDTPASPVGLLPYLRPLPPSRAGASAHPLPKAASLVQNRFDENAYYPQAGMSHNPQRDLIRHHQHSPLRRLEKADQGKRSRAPKDKCTRIYSPEESQYHQPRQESLLCVADRERTKKAELSWKTLPGWKLALLLKSTFDGFLGTKADARNQNPFLFRELQESHWYQVDAANANKAAKHNMSETEVQALTLTKQLFDDDRLAKLIRNPRGWRGCSPKATTVSFQDRLKAYEDENQDAAWEIKIANAKEEAEKQTRQKDDPDQALSDRLEIGFMSKQSSSKKQQQLPRAAK
ncbi:hypothetical protein H2202_001271 [Exophiala xenobiotica]|nr:hypothetical protein H2202_001271 [Exophiala xenobiotica]